MDYSASSKKFTENSQEESACQCVLDSRVMPPVRNHNSHPPTEAVKGHNVREGKVHFNPEIYLEPAATDKPQTPTKPGNTPANSRPDLALTNATTKTPSPTSSSPRGESSSPCTETEAKPLAPRTHFHEKASGRGQVSVDISRTVMQVYSDSSSSDLETSQTKIVIPLSPPTTRGALQAPPLTTPIAPSRLSRLRQNHLASKRKEQMKAQVTKLPELSENSELDTLSLHSTKATTNGSHALVLADAVNGGSEDSETEETAVKYGSIDSATTSSLAEAFLLRLGLTSQSRPSSENGSVDQLTEKEIESKFVNLSLAFKTDRLTLDQRVSVQERSRDLAEKNVDSELQIISDAAENLGESLTDYQSRAVLQKMKRHINNLEQLVAKVSSRAEVFGAVQQERRMCQAMEVMILYSENVRRLREKEESELQEARKLLSERTGNGYRLDSENSPNRRSVSIGGINSLGRPVRRRSEVALPRVLGGAGSPSMSPNANLIPKPRIGGCLKFLSSSQESAASAEGQDPRSRFQSAVASTSMQQIITSTMRQCSLEKQRSLSVTSTLSSSQPVLSPSPKSLQATKSSSLSTNTEPSSSSISECQDDKAEADSNTSQEEEAFRKGFQEGLRAKLSQELNELRDQQNSISHILDHVMDKVDKPEPENEGHLYRSSLLEVAVTLSSEVRRHIFQYNWRSNKTTIRNLTGLILVLLAFAVIFFCPPVSIETVPFAKPA